MSKFPGAFVLCLAAVVSGCAGTPSHDREGDAVARTEAAHVDSGAGEASDWQTYTLPGAGLTVSYPATWVRSTDPLMPGLEDPRELIALGTVALAPGGENCAHMPENAIEHMGSSDALVVIEERVGKPEPGSGTLGDYPRRPARFEPGSGYPSEAVDCLDERKSFFDRFIPFRDSGRRFYAYVAYGDETPPQIRAEAWTILDRLHLEPLADP